MRPQQIRAREGDRRRDASFCFTMSNSLRELQFSLLLSLGDCFGPREIHEFAHTYPACSANIHHTKVCKRRWAVYQLRIAKECADAGEANLAGSRQIGQQKVKSLRSKVPPSTCNLTRSPR
jgi:hypothetical protein